MECAEQCNLMRDALCWTIQQKICWISAVCRAGQSPEQPCLLDSAVCWTLRYGIRWLVFSGEQCSLLNTYNLLNHIVYWTSTVWWIILRYVNCVVYWLSAVCWTVKSNKNVWMDYVDYCCLLNMSAVCRAVQVPNSTIFNSAVCWTLQSDDERYTLLNSSGRSML